jgi:RNA polymerase sigma-70 factor, ECF subfamily
MPQLTDRATRDTTADEVVTRLRAGDESAFAELIEQWSPVMLRVARNYVSNRQSAEDVVQDTWLGVINGLSRFEGRSSIRSWTFSILINRAKTRGVRESRSVASAALNGPAEHQPSVDPRRFQGANGHYPGHWTSAGEPHSWEQPERRALGREAVDLLDQALDQLPERQRLVVTMRDVHGMSADETCDALGVTPQNQRVLLHRGRATLRATLEDYYRG